MRTGSDEMAPGAGSAPQYCTTAQLQNHQGQHSSSHAAGHAAATAIAATCHKPAARFSTHWRSPGVLSGQAHMCTSPEQQVRASRKPHRSVNQLSFDGCQTAASSQPRKYPTKALEAEIQAAATPAEQWPCSLTCCQSCSQPSARCDCCYSICGLCQLPNDVVSSGAKCVQRSNRASVPILLVSTKTSASRACPSRTRYSLQHVAASAAGR